MRDKNVLVEKPRHVAPAIERSDRQQQIREGKLNTRLKDFHWEMNGYKNGN